MRYGAFAESAAQRQVRVTGRTQIISPYLFSRSARRRAHVSADQNHYIHYFEIVKQTTDVRVHTPKGKESQMLISSVFIYFQ